MSKIRVLSVDDSALMRQIMTEIINSHSDMEMVATAPDPLVARDLIKKFNPDVLTLDVEMPRMDGLDFLEKLMRLRPMPLSSPAVIITQHMPPGFTRSFAERLNKLCQISVKEAEDGERVLPGHAYIAPGDKHMELARSGANYQIKIHDGPPVNRHRPSVDVLFHSVAKHAGRNAVGVILTGMGNDGAAGMLAMYQAGAWTIAQNEASCVVFGMPREAINMGGVSEVVDLSQVSQQMLAKISAGQAIRI